MDEAGIVYWLTGLSGSGKTTIARALTAALRKQNQPVIFLDGDELREVTGNMFGHNRDERLKASLLYSRLCKMLAAQCTHVVCATISLFHETQEWNRIFIPNYLEVFIDVPLAEVIKRDPKSIYARAAAGEINNVVGIDIPADFPKYPDVIIHNIEPFSVDKAVTTILEKSGMTYEPT